MSTFLRHGEFLLPLGRLSVTLNVDWAHFAVCPADAPQASVPSFAFTCELNALELNKDGRFYGARLYLQMSPEEIAKLSAFLELPLTEEEELNDDGWAQEYLDAP